MVTWLVGEENIVIHAAKKEGCEGDNENELSGGGGGTRSAKMGDTDETREPSESQAPIAATPTLLSPWAA